MNGKNYPKYVGMVVGAAELEQAILEVVQECSGRVFRTVEEISSLYFIDRQRNLSPLRTGELFATVDLRGGDILLGSHSIIQAVSDQMYLNGQKERNEGNGDPADWWKNT